jgi:hypothetical protein
MKRIVALAVAAAALTAITPAAAQTQCRSDEARAVAQRCISGCGKQFPPSKGKKKEYDACQTQCIAACK